VFLDVSIHAPRAGRDALRAVRAALRGVSIHAPRAGRDQAIDIVTREVLPFQSTRPARGATRRCRAT